MELPRKHNNATRTKKSHLRRNETTTYKGRKSVLVHFHSRNALFLHEKLTKMKVKLHFFYKNIWHIANYILTLQPFLTIKYLQL